MAYQPTTTVVGLFQDRSQANNAVADLRDAGFSNDEIGFAVRNDQNAAQNVAPGTAGMVENAGEGATAGAVGGAVIGGIIGAAVALMVPGIGPVLAGGILATTLGGAAIGAAAGGILGALVNMGVPEEEARYYDQEFRAGRTLVTVRAGDRAPEALYILRRNGASDAANRVASAPRTVPVTTTTTTTRATVPARQAGQATAQRWEDVMPRYRQDWQVRYGNQGGRWEDYEPAYRYGWEMRNNPQYQGRQWNDIAPQVQSDWARRYPNSDWNQASPIVQNTWMTSPNTTSAGFHGQPTTPTNPSEIRTDATDYSYGQPPQQP